MFLRQNDSYVHILQQVREPAGRIAWIQRNVTRRRRFMMPSSPTIVSTERSTQIPTATSADTPRLRR